MSLNQKPEVQTSNFDEIAPQRSVQRSLKGVLVGGDAVASLAGWMIPYLLPGSALAHLLSAPNVESATYAVAFGLAVTVLSLATMATQRMYKSRVASIRTMEISSIGRVSIFSAAAAIVVGKLIDEPHMVRTPLLIAFFIFVFLNLWRSSFTAWLNNARLQGRYIRNVLLVGANDEALSLFNHFNKHPELGYRFVGIVGHSRDLEDRDFGLNWLGDPAALSEIIENTEAQGAIVVSSAFGKRELNRAIRRMLESECHVQMSTGISGIDHRRMHNHSMAYEPMVYVERVNLEGWQSVLKRCLDVVIAGLTLFASMPIMAIAAILVYKFDRGPIFFKQVRVGLNGEQFTMFKFRSMRVNAEEELARLRDQNVRQGPLFKLQRDPRVTPIGRIMRATSIDELPQLLNVLRGDMSLVGPRPALPREVEEFNDDLRARHNVKPGITGLWQVEARESPDFSLYERLDVFYVENWGVVLDLLILLGTAKVVFTRAVGAIARERARSNKSSKQHDGSSTAVRSITALD